MRYQFQVDNRPAGPIRKNWTDAAWDAINAGYATWKRVNWEVHMASNEGASIERIDDDASLAA